MGRIISSNKNGLIAEAYLKPIFKVTLDSTLRSNKGIGPGFEALRTLLAITILMWHSNAICYGYKAWEPPLLMPLRLSLLPMFFCLSGFLVTGSALRLKSLKVFLVFRILRIVPALVVEVTLSAIILGALMTTLTLEEYYSHPGFYSYFGNIIGLVQMNLPSVFVYHPVRPVNANLRTLPPEFYCYGIISLVMITGLFYRKKPYLYLFGIISIAYFMLTPGTKLIIPPGHLHSDVLVFSYVSGSLAFLYAKHIPIHKYLFFLSALLAYLFLSFPTTIGFGLLCVSYCTIYLGMVKFPPLPLLSRGDYSYGIYLYGYPIQQTIWHYIPFAHTWWGMNLIALPATIAFAMASWHLIEKRALSLKRLFVTKDRIIVAGAHVKE